MRKIVVVVAVLVALLVVAPWGIGKLAEKRIEHGLVKLTELAPYLKVVDSKYTTGWFESEQVVTFEAFGPWMKVLNDVMKKEGASAAAVEPEVPAPEPAAESETGEATLPDAAPPPEDSAESPAIPELPLRFTVRNEILHGPVLGFSGLGIARVNSHVVLSDEVRKEIAKTFGPKDPIEVSTRVGFFGGGTTTFKSEGRTIKLENEKVEVTWETFKLAVGYSHNVDSFDVDGKWPKLEVKNAAENSYFVMTDMTMEGEGKRARGDLYDGDFKFGIDKVSAIGKEAFALENLYVAEVIETKGDFTGVSIKMGSGEVRAKELKNMGIEIKEIHYDVGVRRLHTETLAKMITDVKAIYGQPLTNVAELDTVMFAPFKESGTELLKYDPEFFIDRIGIVTADGDGFIKGVVTLKGATAEDFGSGSMGFIGKIHADITIDLSEKMIQKFPNGSTGAGAMVDAGYAKRQGDRLVCKIVFSKGELTVNGKPQAIPGLGGPPSGEGVMPPPPQE